MDLTRPRMDRIDPIAISRGKVYPAQSSKHRVLTLVDKRPTCTQMAQQRIARINSDNDSGNAQLDFGHSMLGSSRKNFKGDCQQLYSSYSSAFPSSATPILSAPTHSADRYVGMGSTTIDKNSWRQFNISIFSRMQNQTTLAFLRMLSIASKTHVVLSASWVLDEHWVPWVATTWRGHT